MSIKIKLFLLSFVISLLSLGSLLAIEIDYVSDLLKNYYSSNVLTSASNSQSTFDEKLDLAVVEHSSIFSVLLKSKNKSKRASDYLSIIKSLLVFTLANDTKVRGKSYFRLEFLLNKHSPRTPII